MSSHILVGFCTKHDSLISKAICLATRWRHSHVVLINADQTRIIESTGILFPDPLTGEMRDGVREVPIEYFKRRDLAEIRKIEHPNPELVWQYAQEMVDKKLPYDHEYLGAWLFNSGFGDEHKIGCFEVITDNALRAQYGLFPQGMRISPRDLYLISKEL